MIAGTVAGRIVEFVDDYTVIEAEEIMEEGKEKTERKPRELKGMALETDIIKKIAHQISRLPPGSSAGERIIQYVQKAVAEQTVGTVASMNKDGQTGLFPE